MWRGTILALGGLLLSFAPAWAVGPIIGSACRISWIAPTTNADGTPLTDLAGYRVYIGTAPGVYGVATATVVQPATTWPCGTLSNGQKYAVVTAFDLAGNESVRCSELPFVLDTIAPAAPSGVGIQ